MGKFEPFPAKAFLTRVTDLGHFRQSPNALSWRPPPQLGRLSLRAQVKFTSSTSGIGVSCTDI